MAAAIHLALGVADLIPGEPTRGWPFLAMGVGYLACAPAMFLRRPVVDALVALWSAGLVLAYVTTRGELPVEIYGVTTKLAETALAAIGGILFIRAVR